MLYTIRSSKHQTANTERNKQQAAPAVAAAAISNTIAATAVYAGRRREVSQIEGAYHTSRKQNSTQRLLSRRYSLVPCARQLIPPGNGILYVPGTLRPQGGVKHYITTDIFLVASNKVLCIRRIYSRRTACTINIIPGITYTVLLEYLVQR